MGMWQDVTKKLRIILEPGSRKSE